MDFWNFPFRPKNGQNPWTIPLGDFDENFSDLSEKKFHPTYMTLYDLKIIAKQFEHPTSNSNRDMALQS